MASLKARAQQLRDSGIEVLRVKLEHEPFDPLSDPRDIQKSLTYSEYAEVHVKCLVPNECARDTLMALNTDGPWRPSRNPFAKRDDGIVQFINRRFVDPVESHLSKADDSLEGRHRIPRSQDRDGCV
jgi:hypothetical protein